MYLSYTEKCLQFVCYCPEFTSCQDKFNLRYIFLQGQSRKDMKYIAPGTLLEGSLSGRLLGGNWKAIEKLK